MDHRTPPWIRLGLLALVCLGAIGADRAQESPGYVADRTALASSAGRAASAGYVLEVTVGEVDPVGSASSCNTGFTHSIGFWSVLGDSHVPIVLQVRHDPLDPQIALLSWSGASPQFDLLRSSSAADARDPLNLLVSTATCDASDPDSPVSSVFYYVVVPTGALEAR